MIQYFFMGFLTRGVTINRFRAVPCLILLCMAFSAYDAKALSKAAVEQQFQGWLKSEIWPLAKANRVSSDNFWQSMDGVTLDWSLPSLLPPGSKTATPKHQRQAEFGSPGNYFSEKSLTSLAGRGRQLAGRWSSTLAMVEQRYGVPGRIILAIWGRESGYGQAKIPHNVFRVLATKAFMSTRKDLFQRELIAALVIVQNGDVSAVSMRSSWAGALGQPQFLPSSYLDHAVDFDGDGKRDIWNSVPDTLASIANYLAKYGWQRGRDWGFEVIVPDKTSCALEGPDRRKKISQWKKMGIRRVSGRDFPQSELARAGSLMMPAGRLGPAFIATENFYVLKSYNESDLYALFIGHLADRIEWSSGGFAASWQPIEGLYRSDVARMQAILEADGHDVGGVDGLPGFKTRRSIGLWQESTGRSATCFPDRDLSRLMK